MLQSGEGEEEERRGREGGGRRERVDGDENVLSSEVTTECSVMFQFSLPCHT